jgi:hypothetical protein
MRRTTGDKLTNKEFLSIGFVFYSGDYNTEIVIDKTDQGFAAFHSVDDEMIRYNAPCFLYDSLYDLIYDYYIVYGYMINYCSDEQAKAIIDSLKEERQQSQE